MTRTTFLARLVVALLALLMGLGCGGSLVTKIQKSATAPRASARWTILPFANHSDTPQAGERV
ncbi:MAG: hypothetical protein IPJ34_10300 [Myxococcales bacterium]|nr:hypothetical protein [Myxococcales bacterium]